MIDFQNGGLESRVYELIAKMCDLNESDEFQKFETTQDENGTWHCKLAIPGVKHIAGGMGKTEVESINNCAHVMLRVLEHHHKHGEYDPDIEESLFRDRIEEYFGDVEYDPGYYYYPFFCGIDLDGQNGYQLKSLLKQYAEFETAPIKKENGEIVRMSDFVELKFLVRKRKKNYA